MWISNRRHSVLCLFCISYKKYAGLVVSSWILQCGQSPDECREQGDLTLREGLNRFISLDWGWGDFSDWTMAILALGHSLRWRARILFEWGQASISHTDTKVFLMQTHQYFTPSLASTKSNQLMRSTQFAFKWLILFKRNEEYWETFSFRNKSCNKVPLRANTRQSWVIIERLLANGARAGKKWQV